MQVLFCYIPANIFYVKEMEQFYNSLKYFVYMLTANIGVIQ
jgi:hypothetical protein